METSTSHVYALFPEYTDTFDLLLDGAFVLSKFSVFIQKLWVNTERVSGRHFDCSAMVLVVSEHNTAASFIS